RVLVPGGLLAVYDVMRAQPGPLAFPVPWASDEADSFTAEPREYREALERAGFAVLSERGWREFAQDSFGPAAPGRPVAMGADAGLKVTNLRRNIEAGLVAPSEIVGQRQ
ncbi:MAG TPA: hypothetical protein VHZ33_10125, partial [Trebonia sp.]|nr:hypothetical protein [Trebonia sp.]